MAKGDFPTGSLVEVLREYKDSGGRLEVYEKAKAEFKNLITTAVRLDENAERDADLLNAIADRLGLPAGRDLHEILTVLDKRLK